MSTELWNDWQRAQKHWSNLTRAGYLAHTPESVFLLCHYEIDAACGWTNRVNDRRAA